jgi:hypothetical protein
MDNRHLLHVTDVTRIAREAVRQQSPDVAVVGVTAGDRNGNYAEVIIDIGNGRSEPRRISVGVFRNAPEQEVRQEIAASMHRHLEVTG